MSVHVFKYLLYQNEAQKHMLSRCEFTARQRPNQAAKPFIGLSATLCNCSFGEHSDWAGGYQE